MHHIRSYANYPSLRYDVNNGIVLCARCHKLMFKNEEGYERLCRALLTPPRIANQIGNMLRRLEREEENE